MIKLAACILLLLAVASALEDGNFVRLPRVDEHNIIWCPVTEDQDKWVILYIETVVQPGKFLQIVEGTTTYPRTGPGLETITCIRVLDDLANGKGGYPEILAGGVGFNYITIRFVSQRSLGFKFEVQIWGMKPDK